MDSNILIAAESALLELKRLHPLTVCLTPDNCPTHQIIRDLENDITAERFKLSQGGELSTLRKEQDALGEAVNKASAVLSAEYLSDYSKVSLAKEALTEPEGDPFERACSSGGCFT